ncbi:MAG TPA: TMEM165/GDT1 family protein, partial [Casimicrobiaceae bacterium]
FASLGWVIAGTTAGMLLVDVPTVLFAGFAARKIPFKAVRIAAAVIFVVLGVTALWTPLPPR